MSLFSRIKQFARKYPLVRGMVAYSVIWPSSCVCQQLISGKENIDYLQVARFGVFGCFFVAPTLHTWLRIANMLWPTVNTRAAITKALVEQVTYTPFAMTCFYFGMTLLEGKGVSVAVEEVKAKFLPTYKVGACVWSVIQTVNHTFIPERNKVPFVGMCSFLWTCFLSYMKQLDARRLAEEKRRISVVAGVPS